MNHFDFEKLDVYQASIEVVVLIDKITESFQCSIFPKPLNFTSLKTRYIEEK